MVETIVTQTSVTKDTGWVSPSKINQKNHGESSGQWGDSDSDSNLGNLKNYDNNYIKLFNPSNLSAITKSPQIACWGYEFDIPSESTDVKDLTIEKISIRYRRRMQYNSTKKNIKDNIIALKVGANLVYDKSTTNVASDSITWNTKDSGFENYIISNDTKKIKDKWGVDVTRSTVMNTNFGCIVSCKGDSLMTTQPIIDTIQMKITYSYTSLERTPVHADIDVGVNYMNKANTGYKAYYPLSSSEMKDNQKTTYWRVLRYVDEGETTNEPSYIDLCIFYKNTAITSNGETFIVADKTPRITLTTNECLRTDKGSTYVIDSFLYDQTDMIHPTEEEIEEAKEDNVDLSSETKYNYLVKKVRIYADKVGVGTVRVTSKGMKTMYNDDNNWDKELDVTFHIVVYDLLSEPRRSKMTIDGCTFINNEANYATQIYNKGYLYINSKRFWKDYSNVHKLSNGKEVTPIYSSTSTTGDGQEYVYGDADGNGVVDSIEQENQIIEECNKLATGYSYSKDYTSLTDFLKFKKGESHAWSLYIVNYFQNTLKTNWKFRIIENTLHDIYGYITKAYTVMYYDMGLYQWKTIPYSETELPTALIITKTITETSIYLSEYKNVKEIL